MQRHRQRRHLPRPVLLKILDQLLVWGLTPPPQGLHEEVQPKEKVQQGPVLLGSRCSQFLIARPPSVCSR